VWALPRVRRVRPDAPLLPLVSCLSDNRLRVFRIATSAHLGRGVGQERWWRVGPSEKYVAR